MSRIFLGRPVHWLIALVVITLGWFAGSERLHVTSFNVFLVLLIVGAVAVLALVILSSGVGEQVTREPIEDPDAGANDT